MPCFVPPAVPPLLAHCFAERIYRREGDGATTITIEVVEPKKDRKGFAVPHRQWIIKRSFS